ncbi:hypothetical protein B0H11DRAFT_2221252 [Mycena galericulata]|nr:hypothetical protein B0H11DRAFT_2221252 [Mycena galericulata]
MRRERRAGRGEAFRRRAGRRRLSRISVGSTENGGGVLGPYFTRGPPGAYPESLRGSDTSPIQKNGNGSLLPTSLRLRLVPAPSPNERVVQLPPPFAPPPPSPSVSHPPRIQTRRGCNSHPHPHLPPPPSRTRPVSKCRGCIPAAPRPSTSIPRPPESKQAGGYNSRLCSLSRLAPPPRARPESSHRRSLPPLPPPPSRARPVSERAEETTPVPASLRLRLVPDPGPNERVEYLPPPLVPPPPSTSISRPPRVQRSGGYNSPARSPASVRSPASPSLHLPLARDPTPTPTSHPPRIQMRQGCIPHDCRARPVSERAGGATPAPFAPPPRARPESELAGQATPTPLSRAPRIRTSRRCNSPPRSTSVWRAPRIRLVGDQIPPTLASSPPAPPPSPFATRLRLAPDRL